MHAANHLRAQKAIKSTRENLREAITGEMHEFKEMYQAKKIYSIRTACSL